MEKMFVIAHGNPFDGLTLRGPFEDATSASQWADNEVRDEDWWVIELEKPDAE